MKLLGCLLLAIVLIYLVVLYPGFVSSTCENADSDSECDARVPSGYCYFVDNSNCRCSKSCKSPPHCQVNGNDTDCMCYLYAASCPGITSSCPTTCGFRANLLCEPLPFVSHASPTPSVPKYSDKVTYSCDAGYEQVGGNTGLRVCVERGAWFVHNVNGTLPVCQPVSCGVPPTLESLVPSSTVVGYYGESVTYSCSNKSAHVGGGNGRHLCNETGHWVEDPSDTLPNCIDMEVMFQNSKAEMVGVAPSISSRGRSNIDCARRCAMMQSCHGYTFSRESMMCSFNTGTIEPVITEMKKT